MTTSHFPAPTLDDVWRAFIETDRLLKESAAACHDLGAMDALHIAAALTGQAE